MEKCASHQTLINNRFYDTLHDEWYTRVDHPIALLRAENVVRTPWVEKEIAKKFNGPVAMLDVGCGAGFLTNALAKKGHQVSGIDLSQESLAVAQKYDTTSSVDYRLANAYKLPFPDHHFDVVAAMDILEHVENPAQLIQEASRVLKPGGLFFYHTFNRNWLSYLLVIKGVDWFVKNAPAHMHVYELFLKPQEVANLAAQAGLGVNHVIGLVPDINQKAFWQMLVTRKVSPSFKFKFTPSTLTGYCGIAIKL